MDNKGGLTAVVAIVLAGVLLGLLIHAWHFEAEAVIGGVGNITMGENRHNLTSAATHGGPRAQTETRYCIFCHTPHRAQSDSSLLNAPLWNHTLSSASYDFTNVPAFLVNGTTMPSRAVDGASKLCLSCHDGTVAIGNVGSMVGNIAMVSGTCLDSEGRMTSSCNGYLGTVPSHHIFSVPMNAQMLQESIANCVSGPKTTRLKYPWQTRGADYSNDNVLLRPTAQQYRSNYGVVPSYEPDLPAQLNAKYNSNYSYGVQCSTCHDPHLYHENASSESCEFLVVGCFDDTAALCTSCHTSYCSEP